MADGRRDDPDNIFDATVRGLARLRDLVSQIADPTAPPRPRPVSGPGRRPPPEASRPLPTNGAGAREPAVDVFDEGAFIRVVADLPGADPATLRLAGAGNRLTVGAAGSARRYERTLLLPADVLLDDVVPTFVNGIMEVLLPAVRPIPPEPEPEPAPAVDEDGVAGPQVAGPRSEDDEPATAQPDTEG